MILEIWSMTDKMKNNLNNQNFEKMKKISKRYDFTQVYQKSWSYATLFLRFNVWQMLFFIFIFGLLFAFYSPNNIKNQNLKKWKHAYGDIIILHMRIKIYDPMMYGSREIVHNRQTNQKDRQMEKVTYWHGCPT